MGILERRLSELGRIRIGDRIAADPPVEGKTLPRKLETFRLTSANKPRLEYAARELGWGGTVVPWEDGPQEKLWQLYTEKDTLPVIVPPFHALSQANELWQGGECRVRCDGTTIVHNAVKPDKIGTPCFCAQMPLQERLEKAKIGQACHTITRLSLLLPDLPGVGVWRFETGSFYAGMELQGATAMLEQASAEGAYIECVLQIEERRVKRRKKGKVQTQVFSVVTLQPLVTMRQLLRRDVGALGRETPAITRLGSAPPAAVEEVWGSSVPTTQALPDDGWREELQPMLRHVSPALAQRCQAAYDNAQTTPGEGLALLHAAYDDVNKQAEARAQSV